VAQFPGAPKPDALKSAVAATVNMDAPEAALLEHPTAAWLEARIALVECEGQLVRNKPLTFSDVAGLLAKETGNSPEQCARLLREVLLWLGGTNKRLLDAGKRYTHLPFKLHQFFSQTGAIYVTLDQGGQRHITLQAGYHVPGEPDRPLFAAVFSRYSGETLLCVMKDLAGRKLTPRAFYPSEDEEDDVTRGYLIPNADLWNPETDLELLPDSWLDVNSAGQVRVQKKYQARIPMRH
ncbi:MAG: DEAD/DEAH box helicase, partial [Limisphaerales bacterium]